MNFRHPNRTKVDLKPNRLDEDRIKYIDSFEVPTYKIGRFVDFEQSPEFSDYYLTKFEDYLENERGLDKGWFSLVDAPVFVEYADLTTSLRSMLIDRSRPRSFGREVVKISSGITKSIRETSRIRGLEVLQKNQEKQEAFEQAIINNDHAEELNEFRFILNGLNEWDSSVHTINPQPRTTPTPNKEAVLTYGFPFFNTKEEMSVRSQIAKIVNGNNMPVPEGLLKSDMKVIPVLDLHVEISAMGKSSPFFGEVPKEVVLGPIEIHKF